MRDLLTMRDLLKEVRGLLFAAYHGVDSTGIIARVDSALSAPDESAIEKVRKIREGGIPGHEVSPYYFTLTDAEAAALIEPSVPRVKEEPFDAELKEACKRIIANNGCRDCAVFCSSNTDKEKKRWRKNGGVQCPGSHSEGWDCIHGVKSAQAYLKEHDHD